MVEILQSYEKRCEYEIRLYHTEVGNTDSRKQACKVKIFLNCSSYPECTPLFGLNWYVPQKLAPLSFLNRISFL